MGGIQRTAEGHGFKLTPGPADHRVNHDRHTWGMFPGLAVELGGYGDVELTNPFTGATFWFQPADHRGEFDLPAVLRQALDAAEAAGFFKDPTDEA